MLSVAEQNIQPVDVDNARELVSKMDASARLPNGAVDLGRLSGSTWFRDYIAASRLIRSLAVKK